MDSEKFGRLKRDGFLAITELVPLSEVEMIRRTLIKLYEQNTGFKEGNQFDALGLDDANAPKRFPQILRPSNYAPSLKKTTFHRLANEMAREVLGPGAEFSADMALFKPPGSGAATPWHQDEAFRDPDFDYQQLTFWLALQKTDQSNGCMEFIPGSHEGPILRHGPPGGDYRLHALECIDHFDPSTAVACALPAGGCTIHTAKTLHGTGPNRSDQLRVAYTLLFDVVPSRRVAPRDFPWQRGQATARAAREKSWRWRGGQLIYMWRRRSRIKFNNLSYSWYAFRRAITKLQR
jgi:hypothetical protein